MKKIMMIAVLMMANVVYGQWLPVSVNTNTGVFKPIDIGSSTAGLTNAYHTSGTVDRAYVSGKSVVVQFKTYTFGNTNTSAGVVTANGSSVLIGTNAVASTMVLTSLYSNANSAYTSNGIGYIVFSTNSSSAPTPPWYRPATNYNGSLLWYSFDTENPTYVVDVTSNGNNGYSSAPIGATIFTNYAAKISSAYENSISTYSNTIADGASELTLAAWLYFSSPVSQTAEFIGTGISSNATTSSICVRNTVTSLMFKILGIGPDFVSTVLWTYGSSLTTGVWHRLVGTYKKNGAYGTSTASMNIYFDGVLKTNLTIGQNGFLDVTQPWVWGSYSAKFSTPQSSVWDGYIDDCIVTPTAWTIGQVTNDYNAGRTLAP